MPIPEIPGTSRLIFRPVTTDDAGFLFRLNNDPEVNRFTGEKPWSMQDVMEFIGQCTKQGSQRVIACMRKSGEPVALCGFRKYEDAAQTDISYRFLEQYRGKGLGKEAGEALLGYAFRTLRLPALRAQVHPENTASIKLSERLGMKLEKIFTWEGESWIEMMVWNPEFAKDRS